MLPLLRTESLNSAHSMDSELKEMMGQLIEALNVHAEALREHAEALRLEAGAESEGSLD